MKNVLKLLKLSHTASLSRLLANKLKRYMT